MLSMKMHIQAENVVTIKRRWNNIRNYIYKLWEKWMHYLLMMN